MVIDNRDFEEVIRKLDSPATLFYCDPPYHTTEGYYKNIGEEGFSETDRSALAAAGGNMLTLYTCVRDERDYRWCVQGCEIV